MAKGFVQLRRSALDHWPDLTDGEIRLWTGMLIAAKPVGAHAGKVFGSTSELMERCGFKRRQTFINARRLLEKRGWIIPFRSAQNQHEHSCYQIAKYRRGGPPSGPATPVEKASSPVENPVDKSPSFPQRRTSGGPAADQRRTSGGPATPLNPNETLGLLAANTLDTLENLKNLKNPLEGEPLRQILLMHQIVCKMQENNPGRADLVGKLKLYAREHEHADVRASAIEALTALGVQAA